MRCGVGRVTASRWEWQPWPSQPPCRTPAGTLLADWAETPPSGSARAGPTSPTCPFSTAVHFHWASPSILSLFFRRLTFCYFFLLPRPPSGENLTIVFTLQEWSTRAGGLTVKEMPTTAPPTTAGNVTVPTTTDESIFSSSTTLSAGCLCLISVIYSVACCSDGIPIC